MFAPRPVRRPRSTLQVNPGSLYRWGQERLRAGPKPWQEERGPETRLPQNDALSSQAMEPGHILHPRSRHRHQPQQRRVLVRPGPPALFESHTKRQVLIPPKQSGYLSVLLNGEMSTPGITYVFFQVGSECRGVLVRPRQHNRSSRIQSWQHVPRLSAMVLVPQQAHTWQRPLPVATPPTVLPPHVSKCP